MPISSLDTLPSRRKLLRMMSRDSSVLLIRLLILMTGDNPSRNRPIVSARLASQFEPFLAFPFLHRVQRDWRIPKATRH